MKRIKLDAIDSTNSFLKEMAHNSTLKDYTVVTANSQTKGKGQMGSEWSSEQGKNLLCSVFVRFGNLDISNQVLINYAVSIAIIKTLEAYELPKLAIKWPNDILSSSQKICGILVENVIQKTKVKSTVIGIGLNVNQIDFPSHLLKATSLKRILKHEVDLEDLLRRLIEELKLSISEISKPKTNMLKNIYLDFLYKKNIPTMFRDSKDVLFMGIIVGVSSVGKLQIQLEDDSISEFGIKEVSIA
jgi:BirA family biotin operon repressor/biotin-[acetyl-CoA-carboxylase] ligase